MIKKTCLIYLLISTLLQADTTNSIVLFSGNSNIKLAQDIARELNLPLSDATVGRFNDGEVTIQLHANVRQKDTYIIQSTCSTLQQSINDTILELFLMIRTLKRASAKTINVVIPYYGYARQDRKIKPRVPISAADIALLLEHAGVDRVITIDLHCGQIQGFFHTAPVDNLHGTTVFSPYIAQKKDLNNVVVVSPDAGGVERAIQFIENLKKFDIMASMGLISKQRVRAGVVGSMHLIGNVDDADAIIVDDICDTGGTLIKAAELLKRNGARRVFAIITHPVFSCNALKKLSNSCIDEIIISNTIPLQDTEPYNVTTLSVAPLLSEAIRRIHNGESVSVLFE